MVSYQPAVQETQVHSLGWEDPLEKGMATHTNILAWRIPWTEESDQLQSMGLQRVGCNWMTNTFVRLGWASWVAERNSLSMFQEMTWSHSGEPGEKWGSVAGSQQSLKTASAVVVEKCCSQCPGQWTPSKSWERKGSMHSFLNKQELRLTLGPLRNNWDDHRPWGVGQGNEEWESVALQVWLQARKFVLLMLMWSHFIHRLWRLRNSGYT